MVTCPGVPRLTPCESWLRLQWPATLHKIKKIKKPGLEKIEKKWAWETFISYTQNLCQFLTPDRWYKALNNYTTKHQNSGQNADQWTWYKCDCPGSGLARHYKPINRGMCSTFCSSALCNFVTNSKPKQLNYKQTINCCMLGAQGTTLPLNGSPVSSLCVPVATAESNEC